MSLNEFLIKKSFNGLRSLPRQTSQPQLLQLEDNIEIIKELYKNFNEYSLEVTISPKSSEVLQRKACGTCGATSLMTLTEQEELLLKLVNELVIKFNLNVLGCLELYNDGIHLHTHMVIHNVKESKIRKIKEYIKIYYRLFNNVVVHINQIRNFVKYRDYLIKDNYGDFFYYIENKYRTIDEIKRDIEEKQAQKKRYEDELYNDPFAYHLYECDRNNCELCKICKEVTG